MESGTFPSLQNSNCSGGSLYDTRVTSGSTYRLRLINHSSFLSFWFSIDNHSIEIVEIDGHEIAPLTARGVNVNLGQRYSIIVHANQTAGNYAMRASLSKTCFLNLSPAGSPGLESGGYQAVGVLSYDDTSETAPTIGNAGNTTNPNGAADNPSNSVIYEGCNDMPFDSPT